jgi:carboxylate-amine ligase
MATASVLPAWAKWRTNPDLDPWTVGVEEEVMLLEVDGSPAWRSEDVLRILPDELVEHARGETHGLALELATQPHAKVADAAAELRSMRAGLAGVVRSLGLRAAVAGTHPLVKAEDVEVSPGARYQFLHQSLRELARREPTFALHVHVAVPDPELAVRALNGIRAHIPVLLALSANSPFTRGRDSGLASARTPVFQAFPRTGIPREFGSYAEYVEAIDILIRCGAIPEPTFIWWDVRLQPRLGTLEVRVMDAQTRIRDTAALVALVQCLVRCEALGTCAEPELAHAPEVLDENRFLAARDGIHAQLLDPHRDRCVPASGRLATLVDACWPHARELGCERELQMLAHLAGDPGATRQRAIASEPAGLRGLLHTLQAEFSPPRPQLALAA